MDLIFMQFDAFKKISSVKKGEAEKASSEPSFFHCGVSVFRT